MSLFHLWEIFYVSDTIHAFGTASTLLKDRQASRSDTGMFCPAWRRASCQFSFRLKVCALYPAVYGGHKGVVMVVTREWWCSYNRSSDGGYTESGRMVITTEWWWWLVVTRDASVRIGVRQTRELLDTETHKIIFEESQVPDKPGTKSTSSAHQPSDTRAPIRITSYNI